LSSWSALDLGLELIDGNAADLRQLGDLRLLVRNKLVERRVEQPNRNRDSHPSP
jgi:hypothetical protein